MRSPCVACPEDDKRSGRYGGNKYCGEHAKQHGCFTGIGLCILCPEGDKKTAAYMDEHGRARQYCVTHAREQKCYAVQLPCKLCPVDNKKQASNVQGRNRCSKQILRGACERDGLLYPASSQKVRL